MARCTAADQLIPSGRLGTRGLHHRQPKFRSDRLSMTGTMIFSQSCHRQQCTREDVNCSSTRIRETQWCYRLRTNQGDGLYAYRTCFLSMSPQSGEASRLRQTALARGRSRVAVQHGVWHGSSHAPRVTVSRGGGLTTPSRITEA